MMTEEEYSAGCSLMKEIKTVELSIRTCYERVYLLKTKIKSGKISQERKDILKKELQEMEKLLATNKDILKKVHKKNQNTFYFTSALCLIVFIIWMLYVLIFGDSSF